MSDETRELTDKQAAFVLEYVKDFNGAAAAIRAGYSPRCARQTAYELMNDPQYAHVADAVEAEKAKHYKRTEIEAGYVVHNLTQIVDATREANPKTAVAALTLLGKHLGMFTDKQEITGASGGPLDVKVTHEVVDPKSES